MSADTVEDEPQPSPFLSGIEFLTGEDPSAGSFLLVVGIVTCVFVAVISFIIGAILDALDYFDTPSSEA